MEEINKDFSTTRMLIKGTADKRRSRYFGLRRKGFYKQGAIDRPLISVITVVYNEPDKLKITLNSVLHQDYDNVEYIIIDGGSKDNATLELLNTHDDYIDYWVSEKDEGIYDAMNKAISVSSGNYITFLNAGDTYSHTDVLSKVAVYMQKDSDVIYGDRNYIKTNNEKRFDKAKDIESIFIRMPFCHQAAFVKRQILEKYKFNTHYRYAADYHLFVRLFIDKLKFKRIDLTVCDYLSGGMSESGMRPHIEVVKILLDATRDMSIIENSAYYKSLLQLSYKELQRIERGLSADQRTLPEFTFEEKLKTKEEQIHKSQQAIQQKDDMIRQNNEMLKQKDVSLNQLNETIRLKDDVILAGKEALNQRNDTIKQKDILLEQRNDVIKQKDILLEQRNDVIKQKDDLISQRNETIRQKDELLGQKDETIKQNESLILQVKELLTQKSETIRQKAELLILKDKSLQHHQELIASQHTELQSKTSEIKQLSERIDKNDHQSKEQNDLIEQLKSEIDSLGKQLHQTLSYLDDSRTQLQQKDEMLMTNSNALREKSKLLIEKEEQLKQRIELLKQVEQSYTFKLGKFLLWPVKKVMGR